MHFFPILLFLLFLKLSWIFNWLLPCGTEFLRELNFSDKRFQDVFSGNYFFRLWKTVSFFSWNFQRCFITTSVTSWPRVSKYGREYYQSIMNHTTSNTAFCLLKKYGSFLINQSNFATTSHDDTGPKNVFKSWSFDLNRYEIVIRQQWRGTRVK